jgi:hypothetical protein
VVVRTDDVVVDKQTDSVVVDESLSLSLFFSLYLSLSHGGGEDNVVVVVERCKDWK